MVFVLMGAPHEATLQTSLVVVIETYYKICRDDRIRTCDFTVPNRALWPTELHPVVGLILPDHHSLAILIKLNDHLSVRNTLFVVYT